MKLQLLVSAVKEEVTTLAERMNVRTDAWIVNQCDRFGYQEYEYREHIIRCLSMAERGVGLSRNTALMRADGDILLFSDEDLIYQDDYEQKVLQAFEQHPQAQVITFNFEVDERRRTYYNETGHWVHWYNYGRYPAYAIAVRRDAILKANVTYSLLYGGGAKYSNGEDSLFLHDCLKRDCGFMQIRHYWEKRCTGSQLGFRDTMRSFSLTEGYYIMIYTDVWRSHFLSVFYGATGKKCLLQ